MSRKRTLRRKLFFNATSHLIILGIFLLFQLLLIGLLSLYLQSLSALVLGALYLIGLAVCVYVSVRPDFLDAPDRGFSRFRCPSIYDVGIPEKGKGWSGVLVTRSRDQGPARICGAVGRSGCPSKFRPDRQPPCPSDIRLPDPSGFPGFRADGHDVLRKRRGAFRGVSSGYGERASQYFYGFFYHERRTSLGAFPQDPDSKGRRRGGNPTLDRRRGDDVQRFGRDGPDASQRGH